MKALILAAGLGERMRPLTERTPKPLLHVGGRPLIEWHIEKLARAGFAKIAINHSHLGHMIEAALGDGARFGAALAYSREPAPLETAGGIATALRLLDADCFAVINGDVFSEFDYRRLGPAITRLAQGDDRAHLVLVDNPDHHPRGDFALDAGRVMSDGSPRLTFSGIAVYRCELFAKIARNTPAKLAPLLYACVDAGKVTGEHHAGYWIDVGTPQRLETANRLAAAETSGRGAGRETIDGA